uniref:PUM-HD domain-containing protein n=1 Tax=Globodera rostochiensis TaxID=31243 RepID=A0A914HDW5_GLORO
MTIIKRVKVAKRSSSPTLGSSPASRKKKRVSFANSIAETRILESGVLKIEGNVHVHSAEAEWEKMPQKGILKQSLAATSTNEVKKTTKPKESEQMVKKRTKQRNDDGKKKLGVKRPLFKKSRTIKIQRSTKEKLMSMSKRERREFIRQLEEKNKPNIELIRKAKLLWEVIRNSNTAEEKREQSVQDLLHLCCGKFSKLVYTHSTCRVVQCLFALNKPDIREKIFDELTPEILRMVKSKYTNFLVSKMLKYGSKNQRDIVINAFKGHCMDLYRIAYSATVLEDVYNEWATAEQRHSIVAEFYGNEFTFFKNEQNIPVSLLHIEAIARNYPQKIPSIVQSLEKLLEKAVVKIPTLKLSLTHKLLLDYLTNCTPDQRQSMIDSLKDQLPEICHSIEGSRAALLCVWNASTKERKAIVNSFKGLAIRSCQDEYARRVLFGIFDTVDDTTLVNEVITKEIANNIADLVYNKIGVWVFHYLVHPRDQRVFGKGLNQLLKQGDSNPNSKKLSQLRYSELFECVREPLMTFIKANMRDMLSNKISSVLVLDTLEVPSLSDPFLREICDADLDECFRAITEIASDEFIPHSPDGPSHIVQGGCARFVFRKLLQSDPRRRDGHRLSDFLADLPAESLSSWTGMDCGCYTLVEMFKSGSDKGREVLRQAITVKMLQNSHLAGAKALLDLFTSKDGEHPEAVVCLTEAEAKQKKLMPSSKRKRMKQLVGLLIYVVSSGRNFVFE